MDPFLSLISSFNRGTLDVPAGLLTPRTTFTLNGCTYESILGGSPDDPLIRLLARGLGGYRTAAKALQYALRKPVATIESQSNVDASGVCDLALRIEGQLRSSGEPFSAEAALRLTYDGPALASIDVVCDRDDLARIERERS